MFFFLLFQLITPMGKMPHARPVEPLAVQSSIPDVVIVYYDDIGARDWELMRAETPSRTPNLDALADQGTTFDNGYAQPMCAPSRTSIYLSEWRGTRGGFCCNPNTNGLGPGPSEDTLPHGMDSLPKAMEGAGYSTGLFGRWGVGTWLGDDPNTQDYAFSPMLWGYETWRAGQPDGIEMCNGANLAGTYSNWLRVDDGNVTISTDYATTATALAFTDWWATTPSPKFGFVSLPCSHSPWHFPPPSAMPDGWSAGGLFGNRPKFEAMIQSADEATGDILSVIDLETTLVIVLSDNGSAVAPAGYTSQEIKFSTFEGGVRVPFIVAGFGYSEDQVSTQPVSEVDIIPTLMDLAGGCVLPHWDGQSFLPALDDLPLDRGWVYVQTEDDGDKAIIEVEWKLRERGTGVQLLYNLTADPFENAPLDIEDPAYEEVLTRLRAELAEAQL